MGRGHRIPRDRFRVPLFQQGGNVRYCFKEADVIEAQEHFRSRGEPGVILVAGRIEQTQVWTLDQANIHLMGLGTQEVLVTKAMTHSVSIAASDVTVEGLHIKDPDGLVTTALIAVKFGSFITRNRLETAASIPCIISGPVFQVWITDNRIGDSGDDNGGTGISGGFRKSKIAGNRLTDNNADIVINDSGTNNSITDNYIGGDYTTGTPGFNAYSGNIINGTDNANANDVDGGNV